MKLLSNKEKQTERGSHQFSPAGDTFFLFNQPSAKKVSNHIHKLIKNELHFSKLFKEFGRYEQIDNEIQKNHQNFAFTWRF